MEGLVNYSSEDECEDSPNPKRNAAEHCPVLDIDSNKRSKGDFSRRPREENIQYSKADKSHGSSHRDKETSHSSSRKNSPKEESSRSGASRFASNRDYYHRGDRRSDRAYDKKRDPNYDRKRRDGHRERDRDYEHREVDRDRRDRSDRYRREKHSKDNSYRDKNRRKSSESPPPTSKDRNTASNRIRNRSKSRSPSKERPSYSKTEMPNADHLLKGGKHPKFDQKDELAPILSSSQPRTVLDLKAVVGIPLIDELPKMTSFISKPEGIPPIALPTYYNPNTINPAKYAEQVQKRKLIWGGKKTEDTAAKWGHATFSEDSDGKVASKFMRLMGIRSAPKPGGGASDTRTSDGPKTGPDVKTRQVMFSNMEQQYEVARQVTHTMRGVGLGFGSQSRQY